MPEAPTMTQIETDITDRSPKRKSLSKDKVITAKVMLLDGSTLDVNVEVGSNFIIFFLFERRREKERD